MPKTLIIGIGNILQKDDGIGVHVAQRLDKMTLPQDVQVIDCGTGLINLLSYLTDIDKLIVIDAIKTGSLPGTIFKLQDKDIYESPSNSSSLHHFSIMDTLKILDKISKKPFTIIIGIEPKEINIGMELSREIENKIPAIINLVLDEIRF